MTLLFDFDGTLVDVSRKYYATYSSFVRERGGTVLPLEDYWREKRAGADEQTLLRQSGLEAVSGEDLRAHVRARIEEPSQLGLDTPFAGTVPTLLALSRGHTCHLVSMRRNPGRLSEQLQRLGLRSFFASVISPTSFPDDDAPRAGVAKADALRALNVTRPALIVGDSGMDIRAGHALGISTCGVTTGVRSQQRLQDYGPDYLIDTITELIPIVAELDGHECAALRTLHGTVEHGESSGGGGRFRT